ncbi:MAG: class I SAM-dependent methyltransferase [Clostridium sp.]|nr:class I SAM-dependent methyltransferase [Clostridium sp.]
MKSVIYHSYEPNEDLEEISNDLACFFNNVKYSAGNNVLLVGNIGNLGNRLRALGVYVTILENSFYGDVCYSLIHNCNCNVIRGCLEALPFEDQYFDKIIILDHFNNISNYKDALKEISRVLKDDGEIILEDLNLKNLRVKFKNFRHKILGENINYRYPNEIINLFSKWNFYGQLKEFDNKRYIYIGKKIENLNILNIK